ncbi:hypothetical protein P170DRAFT_436742 [Aspergillus steynii IBT 23096]|uniref:Mid2 domain-containing protein n=1 Tax=Aspergillus steynii IBT 23096 TaxID=1392250 RepID=A0A2I2G8A0_9EURO|nr:uncharacterized protein P170DRAFT_436742 [Aspergillus steynii IBT 23096]PLB49098.1 hypothetical protein P170DRAFT_436742 [Aspergillus steynii IBT 23096]
MTLPRPSLLSYRHLPFLLLLLSTPIQAWTFVWRNSTGANVAHENKNATCVRIYHQKDLQFSWDPEGPWCLRIWREAECENMIGWECENTRWRKDATRNLSAYDVYPMPEDSVRKFVSTETTGTMTMISTIVSETSTTSEATTSDKGASASATGATPTPTGEASEDGDGGGALSGGAIAGIVVGGVAGVVVLATVFFLWGRRRSHPGTVDEPAGGVSDIPEQLAHEDSRGQFPGSGHGSGPGSGYSYDTSGPQMMETTLVASSDSASRYHPGANVHRPGRRLPVELPGEMGGVELSNSRQLMEMDGEGYVKRSRSSSIAKE